MKSFLLFASMAATLVLASVIGLVVDEKHAQAAFPGKNGKIVFLDQWPQQSVWQMNRDGSDPEPLTSPPPGLFENDPAWSADGSHVAFARAVEEPCCVGSQDIWKIDANGENEIQLTSGPETDLDPAWFPDGSKIAFMRSGEVWVMTLNATGDSVVELVQLTNNASSNLQPAVSPDGTNIAFVSYRDGDPEIFVMQADVPEGPDNQPVQLTHNTRPDEMPDWSPDGRSIVFSAHAGRRPTNWEIFTMNADGTHQTNVTKNRVPTPENRVRDIAAVFSPNGRWIIFCSNRTSAERDNLDIWRMAVDGANPVNLAPSTKNQCSPSWRPLP